MLDIDNFFLPTHWPLYLVDLLILRLVEASKAKNYVKVSYSQWELSNARFKWSNLKVHLSGSSGSR